MGSCTNEEPSYFGTKTYHVKADAFTIEIVGIYVPPRVPLLIGRCRPSKRVSRREACEQTAAQAQVDAHFGPKPAPPPREKVPEEKIDRFIRMARPPAPKPVDSDYERQIRKAHRARVQKESSSSSSQAAGKKCGKTVPHLGEQVAQSIPPLVVPTTHERSRAPNIIVGKPLTFPSWAI